MDPGAAPSSGTAKVRCGFSQALCDLYIENTKQDGQAGDPYSPRREMAAWPAVQSRGGWGQSRRKDGSQPFWIFQGITDSQGLGQQVHSCTRVMYLPPKPAGTRLPLRPHSLRGANCRAPSEVGCEAPGGVRPSSVGSSYICSRLNTLAASSQPIVTTAGLLLAGAPTGKRRVMQSPPAVTPAARQLRGFLKAGSVLNILCAGALKRGEGIAVVFITGGGVWSGPLCRHRNQGSEGLRNLLRGCTAWGRSHLCSPFSGLPVAERQTVTCEMTVS